MPDYTFVADNEGLSSLYPVNPKEFFGLGLYCRYNSQRNVIWGTITLEEGVYEGLKELSKTTTGRIEALNLIKTAPYNFPKSNVKLFKRIMEVIPGMVIDPNIKRTPEMQELIDKLQHLAQQEQQKQDSRGI